jgi:hypothetical protein
MAAGAVEEKSLRLSSIKIGYAGTFTSYARFSLLTSE